MVYTDSALLYQHAREFGFQCDSLHRARPRRCFLSKTRRLSPSTSAIRASAFPLTELERIFEEFYQLTDTMSGSRPGLRLRPGHRKKDRRTLRLSIVGKIGAGRRFGVRHSAAHRQRRPVQANGARRLSHKIRCWPAPLLSSSMTIRRVALRPRRFSSPGVVT